MAQVAAPKVNEKLETWPWLAPEVMGSQTKGGYDEKSDVYSYSMVLYEIFNKYEIFHFLLFMFSFFFVFTIFFFCRCVPFEEFEQFVDKREKQLTAAELNNDELLESYRKNGLIVDMDNRVVVKKEVRVQEIKEAIETKELRPSLKNLPHNSLYVCHVFFQMSFHRNSVSLLFYHSISLSFFWFFVFIFINFKKGFNSKMLARGTTTSPFFWRHFS